MPCTLGNAAICSLIEQFFYLLLAQKRALETEDCSTSPRPKVRKNALHSRLGYWHFWIPAPDSVHGVSDSNAVFLAHFPCFIVGSLHDRRAQIAMARYCPPFSERLTVSREFFMVPSGTLSDNSVLAHQYPICTFPEFLNESN